MPIKYLDYFVNLRVLILIDSAMSFTIHDCHVNGIFSSGNGEPTSLSEEPLPPAAWIKPLNESVVEIAPVMCDISWPWIGKESPDSANALPKSSSDSLTDISDVSLSTPQGSVIVSDSQEELKSNANPNFNQNYALPTDQKSENVAVSKSSPRDPPHHKRNNFNGKPRGGFIPQPRHGYYHPHNSSRRSNYRGRHDQFNPNWYSFYDHVNYGGRGFGMPYQYPNGFFPNMRPPFPPPLPARFPVPPPIANGQGGFWGPPHYVSMPLYIYPDPLLFAIMKQIEYYFSDDNLCKDTYLREHMDGQGFVSLPLVAGFNLIKLRTDNYLVVLNAVQFSSIIEIQDKIRRRYDWMKWLLPPTSIPKQEWSP